MANDTSISPSYMDPPSLASSMRNRLTQQRRVDAYTQTEEMQNVDNSTLKRTSNSLIGGGYTPSIDSFPVSLDSTFSNLLDDDLTDPAFSPSNDINLIDLGHCDDFFGPDSIMTDESHTSSWRLSR
ncbi:hypothetical protein RB195_000784 [Necator americanus]|uniref:Transducer of regulated CREB activity C-terminal domain-containing protein n=1 Tax=Necator americanus TaxID=51031 RepID=A0ABR1DBD1_NECAM